MEKVLIFGNSGSGKSTLAKALAHKYEAEHFDLDAIAWEPDQPAVRVDLAESKRRLLAFIAETEGWVIEGCYSDLLREGAPYCTEMIFLNPGVEACVQNCRSRPWEPQKYETREAQDANLQALLNWVREYETRADELSLSEHRKLFDAHTGRKVEYRSNAEALERTRTGD